MWKFISYTLIITDYILLAILRCVIFYALLMFSWFKARVNLRKMSLINYIQKEESSVQESRAISKGAKHCSAMFAVF
jgi:hypothetical protein